ncbi:hypothetical protein TCEA9_11360 [Thermobrachium celere]|nr:hypothetical protein TCEA9_11360 [Thermobrachium celere]
MFFSAIFFRSSYSGFTFTILSLYLAILTLTSPYSVSIFFISLLSSTLSILIFLTPIVVDSVNIMSKISSSLDFDVITFKITAGLFFSYR